MIEQPVFDILCRNEGEAEIIEKAFKNILNKFLGRDLTLNTLIEMIEKLDLTLLTHGFDPFVIWSIHHPLLYDFAVLSFKDIIDLYDRFSPFLRSGDIEYIESCNNLNSKIKYILKKLESWGVIYKTISIYEELRIVDIFLHKFLDHASITDNRQRLMPYNFPNVIEWCKDDLRFEPI